jgi:predicted aspartyl protease
MGRVTTEATVENLEDIWGVRRGRLTMEQVRTVVIPDALVDTGAIALSLPTRLIQELGLSPVGPKDTVTANGLSSTMQYEAVRLTIQNRSCTVDVLEVPDKVPVLIGQIPLEFMDYVVDPVNRRLIGNPAHGGQQVLEVL